MSKTVKILLYIALGLVALGSVIAAIGYAKGGNEMFLGSNYNTELQRGLLGDKEDAELISDENMNLPAFNSIAVNLEWGQLSVVFGDSYGISLSNYTKETMPKYEVKDGVLQVNSPDQNLEYFSVGYVNEPDYYGVVITIPQGTSMKSLNLHNEDEAITLNGINADKIKIEAECSDVSLGGINTQELEIDNEDGDMKLTDINAGVSNMDQSYGVMNLTNYTAKSLKLSLDSTQCAINNLNVENTIINTEYEDLTIEGASGKTLDIIGENANTGLKTINIGDTNVNCEYGFVKTDGINGNSLIIKADDDYSSVTNGVLGLLDISSERGEIKVTATETQSMNITDDYGDINLEGNFLGVNNIKSDSSNIVMQTKSPENLYSYKLNCSENCEAKVNGKTINGTLVVKAPTENQINIITESGFTNLDFAK
ncbi:MAG: DUF4097 family beta strand repeat-containing protein [Clostridiales bacterium]